jgi:hypothetical protein
MNSHDVLPDDDRHLALSVGLKLEMLPVEDIFHNVEKVTAPCWMKLSERLNKRM